MISKHIYLLALLINTCIVNCLNEMENFMLRLCLYVLGYFELSDVVLNVHIIRMTLVTQRKELDQNSNIFLFVSSTM